MATEFTIGTRVSCSDGPCGEVSRLVTDPIALTVTHLVVQPKHKKYHGRLVPLELIDATTGEVRLRCTLAEFDELEPAEEVDVVEGADYAGGYTDAGAGGSGYSVTGVSIGGSLGHRIPTTVNDVVPMGETQVSHGDHVHAVDGEIGEVKGFVVDPGDGRVTHVLLREGHFWGYKEIAIPVSAVVGIDDGVRLSISKQQVEDLPPVE
jgi:sporulation protein YlmC with PRC-barrel domain